MTVVDGSNPDDHKAKTEKLGALFDLVATQYESNRFFEMSAHQLASFIVPDNAGHLLDVATGTGLVALQLAEKHPQLHITGIDLSQGMLQEAKRKANGNGCSARIDFVQMDAMNLDFDADYFDFVTCSYGIFFMPDMVAALREFLRVLKPGGRLVLSTFCQHSFSPLRELFMEHAKKYGVEPVEQSWMILSSMERIDQFMAKAGVTDYKIEEREIRYEISPKEWWSMIMSTGYRSFVNQIDESQRDAFKQSHMSEISACAERQALMLNADSFYITLRK